MRKSGIPRWSKYFSENWSWKVKNVIANSNFKSFVRFLLTDTSRKCSVLFEAYVSVAETPKYSKSLAVSCILGQDSLNANIQRQYWCFFSNKKHNFARSQADQLSIMSEHDFEAGIDDGSELVYVCSLRLNWRQYSVQLVSGLVSSNLILDQSKSFLTVRLRDTVVSFVKRTCTSASYTVLSKRLVIPAIPLRHFQTLMANDSWLISSLPF